MNEFLPPDDPSRLSKPSVPPLTMTTEDGKPYTRSPEVTENIGESLCWTVALLLAGYTSLLNEALVFNIRRFRGHDEHICGLLLQERAVEQVEHLQRRRRDGAPRGGLAGVGAVEGAKGVVEAHARLALVDHPPPLRRAEGLFRSVDLDVIRVRFEQIEARPAHRQIQVTADRENRVAQRLGLEPPRRVAPQQARRRIGRGAIGS